MGWTALETAVQVAGGQPVEKSKVLPGVLFTRNRPEQVKAYRSRLTDLSD